MSDELDLVVLYRQTLERIIELVSAPDASADAALAACPGWSVRDVLAHMAGVAQDWAAGRRAAPPTDAAEDHAIRIDPLAHRAAQPPSDGSHGMVGRPDPGARSPVPVRAGDC